MLKLHEAKLPIYNITIIFSQSREKFRDYFDLVDFDKDDGVCCWSPSAQTVGIFIEDTDSVTRAGTVAHECFHAVMDITEYLGITVDSDSNESAAYILSWLVEYCTRCIAKDTST